MVDTVVSVVTAGLSFLGIMLEKDIVKQIKTYLKGIPSCFCFKEHGGPYGQTGLPDIIVCLSGRFIALEVKTETGKTTALQELTLKEIRKAGGIAEVVRSVGEVKALVEKL